MRNFGRLILAELFVIQPHWRVFRMNRLFKVMPQHLNRIQVRTLTRPTPKSSFCFLQPFRGGFAGVFWIICPAAEHKFASAWGHETDGRTLSFRIFGRQQKSWFHLSQQVFQILKQQNSPDHHTTTTIFTVGMMFFFWNAVLLYARCNGTHTFQKVHFCLVSPQSIFPKVLGSSRCFLAKLRWALCSFCSAAFLVLELCHAGHFCPVSFLWWSHEHWP